MLPTDPLIDRSSCLAVVPAYNEAATVGGVVSGIQRKPPQLDVLVIDDVYGPRMDYKGTYVSVIVKVLDRIDAGEAPVIFGDGSQVYDFVFVTHRVGSTENAERDLGFVAEIPYEEGLRSVVEWRRSDEPHAVPEQA